MKRSEKLNILVFSWRDPKHPLAGGAEQVMDEHMKGWVEAGNSVTHFSSRTSGLPKRETLNKVEIVRSGYQYLGVQLSGFIYYLKNKDKYDFVVDQFHGTPFFTPLYSNKAKLAVIQESAQEVWLLNPLFWPMNILVGAIGKFLEPLIFIFYRRTHFLTGSESAKKDLINFGLPSKNISIIPHGLVIKRPKSKVKKELVPTVTFLGVLSRDKGIEDALKTFSILKRKGPYQFWVIGKADRKGYFKRIKNLARRLNLGKNIIFWGFVSQQKKFELLARSHVLINPSVHEGWGLVNIEANSMGTPVVAYDSSGLRDSVKDGESGLIVKKNSPEALAKAVLEVVGNKNKYKLLQKGAISWSKNFSWKKSRKMSVELVERVASRK